MNDWNRIVTNFTGLVTNVLNANSILFPLKNTVTNTLLLTDKEETNSRGQVQGQEKDGQEHRELNTHINTRNHNNNYHIEENQQDEVIDRMEDRDTWSYLKAILSQSKPQLQSQSQTTTVEGNPSKDAKKDLHDNIIL